MFLRQSTASQEITLGPFLDDTDGKTAETGLTIANTDIKLWKSGGTTESDKNSGGATHIAGGRYYAVLDATDTNTVGMLEIANGVVQNWFPSPTPPKLPWAGLCFCVGHWVTYTAKS